MNLDPHQVEDIATRAAAKAIEGAFLKLGVDISTPDNVLRAQRVVTFGYEMYDTSNTVKRVAWRTAATAFVTAVIALSLLGFKGWIAQLFAGH